MDALTFIYNISCVVFIRYYSVNFRFFLILFVHLKKNEHSRQALPPMAVTIRCRVGSLV